MKFSKATVLLVCMSAAVMVSAETVKGSKNRKNENRNLKKDKEDKEDKKDTKKSSKTPSMAPTMAPTMEESVCSTCERKLPGYVLFGEAFDSEDFYEESYNGFCNPWVPNPTRKLSDGPPTLAETCCYDEGAFEFCKLIAEISTAIYENDLAKCLLTSLEKVAREYECAYSYGGKSGSTSLVTLGMAAGMKGPDGYALMLGVDLQGIAEKSSRRRLTPLVDELVETFDELVEKLSTPEIVQAFAGNSFFGNCLYLTAEPYQSKEQAFGYCLIVFSFYTTLEATICDYQAACPIEESCTEELKFNTDYTKRRVANSLPFTGNFDDPFILAEIIAPCLPCEAEKSNGCSGFCNYVEGFSRSCDIPDAYAFDGVVYSFVELVDLVGN